MHSELGPAAGSHSDVCDDVTMHDAPRHALQHGAVLSGLSVQHHQHQQQQQQQQQSGTAQLTASDGRPSTPARMAQRISATTALQAASVTASNTSLAAAVAATVYHNDKHNCLIQLVGYHTAHTHPLCYVSANTESLPQAPASQCQFIQVLSTDEHRAKALSLCKLSSLHRSSSSEECCAASPAAAAAAAAVVSSSSSASLLSASATVPVSSTATVAVMLTPAPDACKLCKSVV
eukprot:14558-Heterococcus_DN1.PRE.1